MSFFLSFIINVGIIALCLAFIIAEIVCFANNNRELIYHLIKRWWQDVTYDRKKGKLPTDIVELVKVQINSQKMLTYRGGLKTENELEATLIVRDQLGIQKPLPVPLSVFEEFKTVADARASATAVDINCKMNRSDFDILLITHYNKRIEEINQKHNEL